MSSAVIRVDDAMRYQVGFTRNGIDFQPDGAPFTRPREAVEYARRLDGEAPRSTADDLAGAGRTPTSRDARLSLEAPSVGAGASLSTGTCVVCGGPLPEGSRRQRRTCSDACRERARYRRAAGLPEADEDGAAPDLTVSDSPQRPTTPARPTLGL